LDSPFRSRTVGKSCDRSHSPACKRARCGLSDQRPTIAPLAGSQTQAVAADSHMAPLLAVAGRVAGRVVMVEMAAAAVLVVEWAVGSVEGAPEGRVAAQALGLTGTGRQACRSGGRGCCRGRTRVLRHSDRT